MTAPYRLRDAYEDRSAVFSLVGVVGAAVPLGLFPVLTEGWSAGLALLYVAFWTALLLVNMNTADQRLREVSGS